MVKDLSTRLLAPPSWLFWLGLLLPPILILYPMFGPVPSPLPSQGGNASAHVVAYMILATPHALWLGQKLHWGLLGLLVFSIAMELVQPVFGRAAEWSDLFSNCLGIALGFVLGSSARRMLLALSASRGPN